ncbi:MAG: putative toxin-antitoxin system toxin component, PIN family [Candidatus Binataceae bacterium]
MDRIFLDANVLFSAAHLEHSGVARLWKLGDVQLLSSAYAVEEARRNLAIDHREVLPRLQLLTTAVAIVDAPQSLKLPGNIRLEPQDQPILLAAIHGKADYLLTGDARRFEHLYGKQIKGTLVLRPAQYFAHRRRA